MLLIEDVILSLKDTISQSSYLDSDTQVRLAYRKNVLPNPLRKTYITLNPDKITVLPYHDNGGVNTKTVTYNVGLNIHIPESGNPSLLLRDFSSVLTTLDESGVFGIEEATCGEIKSDSDTNSVYLPCNVKFTVVC